MVAICLKIAYVIMFHYTMDFFKTSYDRQLDQWNVYIFIFSYVFMYVCMYACILCVCVCVCKEANLPKTA